MSGIGNKLCRSATPAATLGSITLTPSSPLASRIDTNSVIPRASASLIPVTPPQTDTKWPVTTCWPDVCFVERTDGRPQKPDLPESAISCRSSCTVIGQLNVCSSPDSGRSGYPCGLPKLGRNSHWPRPDTGHSPMTASSAPPNQEYVVVMLAGRHGWMSK